MAFESLSDRLSQAFKKLKGRTRLTEADIKEVMREVRTALLDADVNYRVVRDFIARVTEKATGTDVLESLTPQQQVIKIVNDELCALMGGSNEKIKLSPKPPTVVMLVGLQGAGKTTNGAKLAALYKKQYNKRPLLVACDVYRPAAITQLQVVGSQVGVPVFEMGQGNPVEIARAGVEHAVRNGNDMVFIDTAGRLHIDDTLMTELCDIKAAVSPTEIMLFLDAMTGQDAVNAATGFDSQLGIDSVFMTKLDADTRGGAALSVRAVTGKPIKFAGTGEKLDGIELFHPDRMASRILGMGDMLTLIEKAQANYDEKKAAELEKKMAQSRLDLNDFLDQIKQLKKMGGAQAMLSMMPGVKQSDLKDMKFDDRQFSRLEAIVLSMTPAERSDPSIISLSRKKRVAAGCGQKVEDVNRLLKQFELLKTMSKQLTRGGTPDLAALGRGKGTHSKKFSGQGGKFKLPF
ncbi:MAG: signal recognition particle protein [Clostridiaceae bacterium]|nr:signal recognition particle protein [Clostridiaceae bacterium]MDY3285103.1 signal recognition particle protein [Eubacteriales bacterium]